MESVIKLMQLKYITPSSCPGIGQTIMMGPWIQRRSQFKVLLKFTNFLYPPNRWSFRTFLHNVLADHFLAIIDCRLDWSRRNQILMTISARYGVRLRLSALKRDVVFTFYWSFSKSLWNVILYILNQKGPRGCLAFQTWKIFRVCLKYVKNRNIQVFLCQLCCVRANSPKIRLSWVNIKLLSNI